MPPTSAAMLTASPRSGQWRWSLHLAALTWLVAVLGWLYWPAIAAAVRVWVVSPTFSHCFLIIPISAWLIWRDRMALRETAPSVYPLALLAIPPLTVIWLAGVLVSINEIQQFALLGIFQLIALSILGRSVYSVISFPCLFLFSMIPTGEYLIGPLQEFTSWFIGAGLDGLHIANYREGSIIELTNGRFEVAEACAGLRFLIATITLGVLFAASMFRRWVKIAVFIVACTVVPVIANGFRALGIVLLAHFTDNRLAVGADHLVYGWGFSVVILLVLFVVGARFRDEEQSRIPVGPPLGRTELRLLIGATALASVLVALGPAAAYWSENHAGTIDPSPPRLPRSLSGWVVADPVAEWHPVFGAPDGLLSVQLSDPSADDRRGVDLAIYRYDRIRKGHELIESTNRLWDDERWHLLGAHPLPVQLGARSTAMVETVIGSPAGRRLIWSCYWIDNHPTTSGMAVKLSSLKTMFTGHESAALLAISTPIDGVIGDARTRLASVAGRLEDISSVLSGAGDPPAAGPIQP